MLTPTTWYPLLSFPIATFVRKRSSTGHGTASCTPGGEHAAVDPPPLLGPGTACPHLPVAVATNSRHLVPMGLEVLNQQMRELYNPQECNIRQRREFLKDRRTSK